MATSQPPPQSTRTRRTQGERSAETRARLLDATVESLIEAGYAHTTTTAVCARAGLSRGAQLHHFPTKSELVIAAVAHLTRRRAKEVREEAQRLAGQLVQAFPSSARVLLLAGRVAYRQKRYERALGLFEDSHRVHPHWRTHHWVGKALTQVGRFSEAEAKETPLDMRMNPEQGLTAADLLSRASAA